MREGFDIAFEMSGFPTALPLVIDNMNHGGRIAILGLPSEPFSIDWGVVVTRMLTLKGIYGREMFETWNSMSAMLHTSEVLRAAHRVARLAPVRRHAVAGGVRRGRVGRGGQGHHRLDADLMDATTRQRFADELAAIESAGSPSTSGRWSAPSRRSIGLGETLADELLRQQLPGPGRRRAHRGRRRRRDPRPWASGWPASGSSAARRTSTWSSSGRSRASCSATTRSCSRPASTRTAGCSRSCSAPTTRSSPTSSTTPRSSTASACARRSASATATPTWPTSRPQLVAAAGARTRVIVTDGVFSMDGSYAPLDGICDLAERYDAMVLVDDSHAVGSSARAVAARRGCSGWPTASTSSPARSARRSVARRAATSPRSRRSSTCCASARGRTCSPTRSRRRWSPARSRRIELVASSTRHARRWRNAALFRELMTDAGFDLLPGSHPIVPVMFGDAVLAAGVARALRGARRLRDRVQLPGRPPRHARGSGCSCPQCTPRRTSRACVEAFVAARDEVVA